MTCIAAMVHEGRGYIAADSLGSNRYTKSTYANRKIFRKGDMLIGYTSSYRMGQILQYRLELPDRHGDLEEYLHVHFIDAVRAALADHGYMKIDSNREEAGTFLIVTEGRIFTLQGDLAILESTDPFDSVGSGEDYARATMHALYGNKPKDVLIAAIESAAKYTTGVGGDIHILKEKR